MATFEMDFFRDIDRKWIKENADNALNFKEIIKNKLIGAAIEISDGFIFGEAADQVNRVLTPRVQDNIKIELHEVFDKVQEGDYKTALIELTDVGRKIAENKEVSIKALYWIELSISMVKAIISELME